MLNAALNNFIGNQQNRHFYPFIGPSNYNTCVLIFQTLFDKFYIEDPINCWTIAKIVVEILVCENRSTTTDISLVAFNQMYFPRGCTLFYRMRNVYACVIKYFMYLKSAYIR